MAFIIEQKGSGRLIAQGSPAEDTALLYEGNWYFNPDQVDMTHLKITERTYTCPYKGVCFWIDLEAPELTARNVAWVYNHPMTGHEIIRNRIGFYARETAGTVAVKREVQKT